MLRRPSHELASGKDRSAARSSSRRARDCETDLAAQNGAGRRSTVLSRPEAELRRESNGKEPWVFRAAGPSELLGAHAELVGQALEPGESLRYLLYSPMWDGRGGPFGIRATPASHAVAVTGHRFVISADEHLTGAPPSLLSIPFPAVVSVESGSALMLGWLVIRYVEGGAMQSATVLYRALGRKHVTAAVRAYRAAICRGLPDRETSALPWSDVSQRIGERAWEELEPLLTEAETPLTTASWHAVHGLRRRGRGDNLVCLAAAGALLVSSFALFVVGSDPEAPARSPNFGVNALCVPLDALRAVTLTDPTTTGPWVVELRLEVGRKGAGATIATPFPGERLQEIEAARARLAGNRMLNKIRWSS
jgi:hypothetical protein